MTEIEQLEAKNAALSRELDKVTEEKFHAQEIATELKRQLEEVKHTEQLGGWAIDRALEFIKLKDSKDHVASDVTQTAQHFCEWIKNSSAKSVEIKGVV